MRAPSLIQTRFSAPTQKWEVATKAFYETHAADYADSTRDLPSPPIVGEFLESMRAGDQVADLGCGGGRDLKTFRERQLRPIGLDYSLSMCAIARRHANAPVVNADMRLLPLRNQEFAGVSAIASLLHLPRNDVTTALHEVFRILKPGGLFVSSVKRGTDEYQDEKGRWFSFFERDEWITLLTSAGFTPLREQLDRETRDSDETVTCVEWVSCLSRKG